jgi:hypothetical protein
VKYKKTLKEGNFFKAVQKMKPRKYPQTKIILNFIPKEAL